MKLLQLCFKLYTRQRGISTLLLAPLLEKVPGRENVWKIVLALTGCRKMAWQLLVSEHLSAVHFCNALFAITVSGN